MTSRVKYGSRRKARAVLYMCVACVGVASALLFKPPTVGAFLPSFLSTRVATPPFSEQVIAGYSDNSQTVSLLQAACHNDPNMARGGGAITVVDGVLVPERSPRIGVSSDAMRPASADQIAWHVVEEGDTLSQIATMYDVSVNTIVWANELASNKDIRPGQTLLILPISGVRHTVAKGDTVKSLATKYRGDVDEILAYNDMQDSDSLVVGNVITIPGGAVEEVVSEPKKMAQGGTVVSSGPSISGYYVHPLPGSVRTQGLHGYNAVDFGASAGTPIRAAAAGSVIVSRAGGWNGGYGNYVVISHSNGTQTLYAHNSKNVVWQGQSVVQGQVVGYVGNTGRSTGPHLHFEVRGAKNPF